VSRGWIGAAVVVAAAVAVSAAGASTSAPLGTPVQSEQQPLAGVALVCPQSREVEDAQAGAQAVALPVPDLRTASGQPRLGLRPLLGPDTPREPTARTQVRGDTLAVDAADVSVLATGAGSLAAAVVGQVTTTASSVRTAGLGSAACVEPARDWWFVGGDGGVGRRSTLVLANASSGPAVADVEVWTEDGPLAAAGADDVGVPARGTRTVSIDAVASGADRVAVHVRASVGTVGAALAIREVEGADPIGLTWVAPSLPPTTLAYVPGLVPADIRSLRLLNPGEEDVIAAVRVLGEQAPFTPLGLEAIDVPAGTVVDVDLGPGEDEVGALEVVATGDVVSSVRLDETPADALPDFAVLGSTAPVELVGALGVSAADERTSTLVVTALPEQAAPVSPSSATPDVAASPLPTLASPPAAPDAASDPATVAVQVWVLDTQGLVVAQREAALVPGTSQALPLDLPADLDAGWVVVRPAAEGQVVAARWTAATARAPDPLDPDADRPATWLDVTPVPTARTSVTVPPVTADVAAGLPGYSGPE
jgi:hypothetical protein